jgi:sigma-B regulation protein RsbU (phosphoserine phosphatase)
MKLPFSSAAAAPALRKPRPAVIPNLKSAEICALYRAARIGGDFFDFATIEDHKLVFLLMDVAGKRDQALHIAAAAQESFQSNAERLFSQGVDDAASTTALILELNRELIKASGGVCYAPAFLGSYDEFTGIVTYINAGHTPGVLKDQDGTLLLEANGLPLGLFSHATHDSQFCAMRPGAGMVLVSKGVVEKRSGSEEFGIEKVQKLIATNTFSTAQEICEAVLDSVDHHEKAPSWFGPALAIPGLGAQEPNDSTTLALLRR